MLSTGRKVRPCSTVLAVTRYGLAIKALLKGAQPLGDDEEQGQGAPDAETTEVDAPDPIVAKPHRIRPQWVGQLPQPGRPTDLRDFWTRGIWQEAARDSAPLAARQPRLTDADEDQVFGVMKSNSLSMREAKWHGEDLSKVTYSATTVAPDAYLAGWQRVFTYQDGASRGVGHTGAVRVMSCTRRKTSRAA